jgi:predicted porin
MNNTDVPRSEGFPRLALGLLLLIAVTASAPAFSQQKTGPGITGDDSLTWHGITLYGVIDIGLQYETHGAPFSDYRPAASGNIVQKNSRESIFGATPSNMGQSRVGLQGNEPLYGDWSGVFQVETFFNPQSGDIADSLKSLTVNNGKSLGNQSNGLDGSSAGQAFQTAFVGIKSARFGALTAGRQLTLLSEGTVKYDPNYDSTAFGLLGASNTYSGGGSSEDKRLDSMLKYTGTFEDLVHVGALYKFNGASGSANTAFQADIGAQFQGASIDAYYSKVNDAISASSLSAAQVAELPKLGYSSTNSVSATISDNTAFAVMAFYQFDPLKFFAGYEHIKYANPTLELTVAYYGYHQNAYGTGAEAGCSTAANSACSGSFEAFSFDADYHFNKHFDAYAGAMYSGVHDGVANGYIYYTTNINPTIGVRYKF